MIRLFTQILLISLFISSIFPQPIDLINQPVKSLYDHNPKWVRHIIRDKSGFMWFGTESGLMRYDGYTYKIYNSNPANPQSLSHNEITAIYESPNDSIPILWIGTVDGLNRFDLASELFTQYQNDPDDPASISYNFISSICEDDSGYLWIGTLGGGLNKFDRKKNSFKQYLHDPNNKNSLMHNKVVSLYFDNQQNLWIGAKGGVDLLDPKSGKFIHYKKDDQDPGSLSNHHITAILQDQAGVMWFASGCGLNKRILTGHGNIKTKFQQFLCNPKNQTSLSHNWIQDLLEDENERFFVGTYGNGIDIFDRKIEKFYNYEDCEARHVYQLYEDTLQNIIWAGTDGEGVFKICEPYNNIQTFLRNPGEKHTLSDNYINTIYEDIQGNIWLTTQNGGLNKLDAQSHTFTNYMNDPADPYSIPANRVTSICQDKSGRFWVGTSMGLTRFNQQTEKFTLVVPAVVECLQQDQLNPDILWIGTTGTGLIRYSIQDDEFKHFMGYPGNQTGLVDNCITYIYTEVIEDQSIVWIGTYREGLIQFNPEMDIYIHYDSGTSELASLSSNSVWVIQRDSHNTLWVGTERGLYKLNKEEDSFIHYGIEQGLPGEMVFGILEDENGFLWLSTVNGISKFDPQRETFQNYDVNDGFSSSTFTPLSFLKNKSGEFYFGSTRGFCIFHPDSFKINTHIPPIMITDFQVLHKSVKPGAESPLKKTISFTKEITLQHHQNIFSLEFAALDYLIPEKNKYAHKLEGFESDWVYTDAFNRRATYTNLDPREYIFRVKGSNNDGIWNEEGTSVKITILPP